MRLSELDKLLIKYNTQPNQQDFDILFNGYYRAHIDELRDNYEKSLLKIKALKKLPSFGDLPILVFRLEPDFSVVFDKVKQEFLLDGGIPLFYELIQAMQTMDDSVGELWDFYCRYNKFTELSIILRELAVRDDYSQVFLQGVEVLKTLAIEESIAYYWEAKFYFHQGNYQDAEKAMIKALNIRKIDKEYWEMMSAIQDRLGNEAESYFYKALLIGHYDKSIQFAPKMEDPDVVKAVSLAGIGCNLAPFMYRLLVNDHGKLERKIISLAGEYLSYNHTDDYSEYCGIYNSYTWKNYRSDLCDKFKEWGYTIPAYGSMTFDIVKSIRQSSLTVDCAPGMECIVPLAGENTAQRLVFVSGSEMKTIAAAKREFSFYRFGEGQTKVVSDRAFQVGKPIRLGHSNKRKKLVLQIFADGLPWQVVKEQGYKNVPHIMKFFSSGIIFENNFSFSEYTYPSVPTLETGYYAYHTQVFNEKVMMRIDDSKLTTSEQMSDLGYYCVCLMSDGAGVYNGALRGFDRKIIQQSNVRCYEGIERLISHLDAFEETDNYAYIHFADAHPYFSDIPESDYVQTKLPLCDRLQEDYNNSVFMENSKKIQEDNQYRIRRMDTQLQLLFDYIQEHYAEDEYIVALYSDHGTSVYDKKNYLLSERQSGAAMMFRGGGVPKLGKAEELTSSADLYPIMGRLCGFPVSDDIDGNLPAVLGGKERNYVVSMSIFPGQTFKLCLRDQKYEFRLETTAHTSMEGLVDMSDYKTQIYRRCDRTKIHSDRLSHYFMSIAWLHIKSFAVNERSFRI